jgi:hypothetical protein
MLIWIQLAMSMAILEPRRQIAFAILYSSLGIGLWAIGQLPLWAYRSVTTYRLVPIGIIPAVTKNQFSIAQLLYLTFVVAALLALGQLLLSLEVVQSFFSFRAPAAILFGLLVAAIVMITLLALKTTLLNRRGSANFGWATLVVCLIASATFWALHRLNPPGMSGPTEKLLCAASVIGQYFWMAINLHVLRRTGWRLVPGKGDHSTFNRDLESAE